jgi:IS5 family transposase
LWESVLSEELQRLPEEVSRVDVLLDDPAFFTPFEPFFDPRMGRPSTPMETYLRLMFLKFRYRLGYESLCREVADSISWRRFYRIGLDGQVPHPTTLMKLTTRCGEAVVAGLNEALLAKAAAAKLLCTDRVRADTTVVEADVGYPTDSGLLAKAIGSMARSVERIKTAGGARRTRARDRRRSAGRRAHPIAARLRLRGQQQRDQAQAAVRRITSELAGIAEATMREATAVVRNAKRALRRAAGQRKGRQRPAIKHLSTLMERAGRVVAQTRSRLGGVMPESASRLVSRPDVDARPVRCLTRATAGASCGASGGLPCSTVWSSTIPSTIWALCPNSTGHELDRLPEASLGDGVPSNQKWRLSPVLAYYACLSGGATGRGGVDSAAF